MSKKALLTQEDMIALLDNCYTRCLDGVPHVSPSIEEMAQSYLAKNSSKALACQSMIKDQILKCTTSGFLTGFGGIITLPIAIPANVGSVLYVQMRMIACAAYMADFDLRDDHVQAFVYACLAGVSMNQLVKQAGIKFGVKFTTSLIKKIPGKVLTVINQKVGFRLVTKFGTKGIVNLGKMVPGVGAVIGGGMDFVETKVIGERAYRWFFEQDFSKEDSNTMDDISFDIVEAEI